MMRLSPHLASLLDWRRKSPLRGIFITAIALLLAMRLSHFPSDHATPWLVLPCLIILVALSDTVRCMRERWNWYHGGVILTLYMELMALTLVLFFLVYPYSL